MGTAQTHNDKVQLPERSKQVKRQYRGIVEARTTMIVMRIKSRKDGHSNELLRKESY
jgi:hypothetical protein